MSNESTLGAVSVAIVGFLIQGFGLMVGILIAYGLYKWVSKDKKKEEKESEKGSKDEGGTLIAFLQTLTKAINKEKEEEKKLEPPKSA